MSASENILTIDHSLPVLDQLFLAEMVGHDLAFAKEMLAFFLQNSRGYLSELSDLTTSPHDEWRPMVHKFKGAARSIGAKQLAAAGQVAESYLDQDSALRKAFVAYAKDSLDEIEATEINF